MEIILDVSYSKGQFGYRRRYCNLAMGWAMKKSAIQSPTGSGQLKCNGTRAETRFRLSTTGSQPWCAHQR